jgi:hypothetical protein
MSAISKQALLVDNNQSFPNNNAGEITPSDLKAFNVNVIDSTVNQTEYTSNSGSWNVSISNLNAFTASQQPSFTALNSFTASQLGINSGVNSFTQSATGRLNNLESTTSSLNAWSSSINEIRDNGVLQGYSTRFFFEGLVSASIVTNVGGNIATINIEQDGTKLNTSSFNPYTASTNQRIDSLEVFSGSAKISISALNAFTTSVSPIQTGSLLTTASYSGTTITYTKGDASTFTNVGIQNTASFNSYTASTNSRLSNIETTTASLNTSIANINTFSASTLVSISNINTFTQSIQAEVDSLQLVTGSYATTGSNTFTGDQTLVDAAGNSVTLSDVSGSLMLVAKSFTSASAHISASTSTQVNLIFKNNSNTGDTIISGSNNLFVNPATPTAGFKRYIGGSGNIMLNASNVPLISGSMAFSPTMNNNLYPNNGITTTMRGPVSSSAWTISGNIINQALNIGSTAANNAEKIVAGLTVNTNILNNSLTVIANRRDTTQVLNITTNQTAFAATTLNAASSSLQYVGNFGGALTLNNNASGSGVAIISSSNATYVAYNTFAALNTTITTSGSSDPNDLKGNSYIRHIENNAIFGNGNTANLPYAETGSNALASTMIAGFSLGVTGSNASNLSGLPRTEGSAFFGRYNALDGNKAQSAQTVFAVGTGNSTTRKTGFLIDSGSNTYVEGTLNVIGNSTFTGSIVTTGSVAGNVVSMSIVSSTASMDLSKGNFFTLTLPSNASTRISPTNIQPGQTANLLLTTGTLSTASFEGSVKFATGSVYVPTQINGANDILTFISFDNSIIYASSIKTLV